MPQLAGQSCVICAQRIDGDFDSIFCAVCGCPHHVSCTSSNRANASTADGPCTGCGATKSAIAAFTGTRHRLAAVDPNVPPTCAYCGRVSPPGSSTCECGFKLNDSSATRRVLVNDAASRNILVGIFTLLVGLFVTAITIVPFDRPVVVVLAWGAIVGGMGMIVRGLRQAARARRVQ